MLSILSDFKARSENVETLQTHVGLSGVLLCISINFNKKLLDENQKLKSDLNQNQREMSENLSRMNADLHKLK